MSGTRTFHARRKVHLRRQIVGSLLERFSRQFFEITKTWILFREDVLFTLVTAVNSSIVYRQKRGGMLVRSVKQLYDIAQANLLKINDQKHTRNSGTPTLLFLFVWAYESGDKTQSFRK